MALPIDCGSPAGKTATITSSSHWPEAWSRRVRTLTVVNTFARQPSPATLAMNDIAHVTLNLAQPIFADTYETNRTTGAFILIDEATNQTVAAGMIEQL